MAINNDLDTIGKRLKFFRKSIGLTQQEFANSIGVSQGNLSEMEKDKFAPSSETIISIIRYYKISADWILTGITSNQKNISTQQKNEIVFDPDFKMMIDVLKKLMESGDPDLRGWTKIQFKNAFKDYCIANENENNPQ